MKSHNSRCNRIRNISLATIFSVTVKAENSAVLQSLLHFTPQRSVIQIRRCKLPNNILKRGALTHTLNRHVTSPGSDHTVSGYGVH